MAGKPKKGSKKLYRSKKHKLIGGVCGGIAEHFSMDPTIIRLLWAFGSFIWPPGFVLYLFAWLIMPENSRQKS